jgi:hypothetical protein
LYGEERKYVKIFTDKRKMGVIEKLGKYYHTEVALKLNPLKLFHWCLKSLTGRKQICVAPDSISELSC